MSHERAQASQETISSIVEIIRYSGMKVVHYVGDADERLMKAILDLGDDYQLSVMDEADSWGCYFQSWAHEEGYETPQDRRPDWLKRVAFYFEGAPFHKEILIRDWAWDGLHHYDSIKSLRLMILFGEGTKYSLPWEEIRDIDGRMERKEKIPYEEKYADIPKKNPSYDWAVSGDLQVGIANCPSPHRKKQT